MSGFVYVWYDRKKKRYYVGSHWGRDEDGYVCSSTWMKQAYKKRPESFRRRIVARVTTTRSDLLDEEQRWLDMIKPEEMRFRYYNLTRFAGNYWHTHGDGHSARDKMKTAWAEKREWRIERLRDASKRPEVKARRSAANKGKTLSQETKDKISAKLKGRPIGYVRSEETRAKISANSKRLHAEGRIGKHGSYRASRVARHK